MLTQENIISGGVGAIALLICQIIGNLIRIQRERSHRRHLHHINRAAGTQLTIRRCP